MIFSANFYGQNFEGSITYKMELINPNPEIIPQKTWDMQMKSILGDKGYMVQKYFYKKNNYISEIITAKEEGYLLYNPKNKLLYAWQKGTNQAVVSKSTDNADEIIKIERLKGKETILNIECNIALITSKAGTMKIWYNNEYFKMSQSLYSGHKYGHWETILREFGCIPLKIEQKGYMSHGIQTVISFKKEKIDNSKFKLPNFEKIITK